MCVYIYSVYIPVDCFCLSCIHTWILCFCFPTTSPLYFQTLEQDRCAKTKFKIRDFKHDFLL